jgi:hypothetical protein
MRFQLTLQPEDEAAFHQRKLFEIILKRSGDAYFLNFRFGDATGAENVVLAAVPGPSHHQPQAEAEAEAAISAATPTAIAISSPPTNAAVLPDYVLIGEAA